MRRLFIVAVLCFGLGYAAHRYLPDPFVNGKTLEDMLIAPSAAESVQTRDVIVSYDGASFTPANVRMEVGRYLIVVNKSDSLMWLISDNTDFNTVRGYGREEQVRVRIDRETTFSVANKLLPGPSATITVVK